MLLRASEVALAAIATVRVRAPNRSCRAPALRAIQHRQGAGVGVGAAVVGCGGDDVRCLRHSGSNP